MFENVDTSKKARKRTRLTSARRLFDDEDQQLHDDWENAKILLPAFVEELSRHGMICEFLKFMELVTKNLFPLTNIALQLFLEVVHWYSCNSTTEMHYSEATKQFWLVGYRLFHGSFIRFMSGEKNEYGVLTAQGTLGNFSPQNSQINFAVPSITSLQDLKSWYVMPRELTPGIIKEAIQQRTAENGTYFILSVDGKKVAPVLNQHSGDQDRFGHKEDISLSEAQDRFQQDLTMLSDLKRIVAECANLEELQKLSIVEQLKDVISCLSCRIRDLRIVQTKQTMALEKFRKIAGKDWRSSKYVWAI